MKKKVLIPLIVIVAAILAIIIYSAASRPDGEVKLTTTVQKGDFEILVSVTGELQAENSVEIRGPFKPEVPESQVTRHKDPEYDSRRNSCGFGRLGRHT